ncbi:MAG: hypothetical protein KAX30_04785 [Candidatus Atribacteria bacterium]|nr:hypothetical protein [Candidatus Atribacteria bacterium]
MEGKNVLEVKRTIGVVGIRPSTEAANQIADFFVKCLEQRNYPLLREFKSNSEKIKDSIDNLLIMRAIKNIELSTKGMEVSLEIFNVDDLKSEDMSIPSLGVIGDLEDREINITINLYSKDYLKMFNLEKVIEEVNKSAAINLKVQEFIEGGEDVVENLLKRLGLPVGYYTNRKSEVSEAIELWKLEKAFIAKTVVLDGMRILIVEEDVDASLLEDKILPIKNKLRGNEYILGVLLMDPFTKKEGWAIDDGSYEDTTLGKISEEEVKNALHYVLTNEEK